MTRSTPHWLYLADEPQHARRQGSQGSEQGSQDSNMSELFGEYESAYCEWCERRSTRLSAFSRVELKFCIGDDLALLTCSSLFYCAVLCCAVLPFCSPQ